VDTDAIETWEEAGLFDPADPGAAERLALLDYLTQRGATIEQMVEAHRTGSLPGVAGDLVTQGRTPMVPVTVIAERSGLEVPRVLRALLAAGIPADPDTLVPADVIRLMSAFEAGSALMGDEAILAFTRVLGAAAMNIAHAAIALFFAELGPGTVREGPDELARARISEAATTTFTAVPDVLARVVMDQFERAQRRAQAARSWREAQADSVSDLDGPTEIVAIGFVDLVGSTAWAQTLGLREQNLALTRFESAAWSSAVLAGGRVVKMIGDEVFFAAPDAETACRIGSEVCRAAGDDAVLPPARGVVGIGPVTPREGDYFGPLVNLVSRIVKTGGPGELVVTEPVARALDRGRWSVLELSPVTLRDVAGPVRVFSVEPLEPLEPLDPVG
jgi:adenylate cyclase